MRGHVGKPSHKKARGDTIDSMQTAACSRAAAFLPTNRISLKPNGTTSNVSQKSTDQMDLDTDKYCMPVFPFSGSDMPALTIRHPSRIGLATNCHSASFVGREPPSGII